MNRETQDFLLRHAWSAIYYECLDEYAIISPWLNSISLEEMKERLEELNLQFRIERGETYLAEARANWIAACDEFLSVK